MKILALFVGLLAAASARPRFLLVPIEDVAFVPHHRVARSAFPEEEEPQAASISRPKFVAVPSIQANRRQTVVPQTPSFELPAELRQAADNSISGSGPVPSYKGGGDDAVDYGAYTGGYGAFGWYSNHPNFEGQTVKGR